MIFVNEEAEQWILGAFLVNNAALLDGLVKSDDFYFPQHIEIYNKMQELLKNKGEFTYVDIAVWADQKDLAEGMIGRDYIRALADQGIGTDIWTIRGYAEMVTELSRKRKLHSAAQDVLTLLRDKNSDDAASRILSALGDQAQGIEFKTSADLRLETIEQFKLPPKCHETGLARLDKAMGGGLYEGFTYGLCGAEKAGKTTLAHTISYNLKEPHLYVAMEMGSLQIEQRNIARNLGINSLAFLKREDETAKNIARMTDTNKAIYYDAPGADIDQILRALGAAVLKHNITGFILDYWQLVGGQQRGESEERHLRNVAQSIADYARKKKLWCILLAQMNKDGGLFGGNGLRKACDQLYMIEQADTETGRWLRMDASRYTFRTDIGSASDPYLFMNTKQGPHFYEA